jgi:hypothetical protein
LSGMTISRSLVSTTEMARSLAGRFCEARILKRAEVILRETDARLVA